MILQLTDHCNIAFHKEMLSLLHSLGDISSGINTSVSARNLTGTSTMFTSVLISHNAQDHPMNVIMVVFFVQGYVTMVS